MQSPSYIGRKPASDDMQTEGVWIRHGQTGVVHLVFHKPHIQRMLLEGGQIVLAPETTALPAPVESADTLKIKALEMQIARLLAELEQKNNASEKHDGGFDQPDQDAHSRPGGRKPTIR